MIRTVAKAETAEETPGFVNKFKVCPDMSKFCAALKEQGYTHYLNLKTQRVTVGPIEGEYRVLVAAVFLKDALPSFDELKAGTVAAEIPILEQRKFYSMMSSVGRGDFSATLDATDVKDWIAFFESEPGSICEIDQLI